MKSIKSVLSALLAAALLGTGIPAAQAQSIENAPPTTVIDPSATAVETTRPADGVQSALTLKQKSTPFRSNGPALAAETGLGTGLTTGVSLGNEGAIARTSQAVDQQAVYANALNTVKKWRQDALNDTRITFPYRNQQLPVRTYLQKIGMSESEYLSPKWSNGLERIALQRAIEAYDAMLAHDRPNGESCWSATYKNVESSGEILAWGYGSIQSAIDNGWASEKADYIKELAGQDHGVTEHYTMLVDPYYKSYGFAGSSASIYGTAWSGEGSYRVEDDQSATNLKGTYDFSIAVGLEQLNQGAYVNIPEVMKAGQSVKAVPLLAYQNGRYELLGTWESTNPSVVSVDANGNVRAVGAGTASVKLIFMEDKWFELDVEVVPITLSFSGNGATSGALASISGAIGNTVTIPANPYSYVGRTFVNWNTQPDGKGQSYAPNARYTFTDQNVTLYAQWKLNTYVVKYDVNGGTFTNTDASTTMQTVSHGNKASAPTTAKMTGHYVEGWYTAKTGGSKYDFNKAVTGPLTLYAHWKTISFTDVRQPDANGNNGTPHAEHVYWMADSGLTDGYANGNGTYRYEGMTSVYRQDMAAFLRRLAVKNNVGDAATWKPSAADWNTFKDVNRNTPHAEDILWLAHAGISEGWVERDGSRTFRGMSSVVRQDMAAFLRRLAVKNNVGDASTWKPSAADWDTFKDVNQNTPHAEDILWLAHADISEGWDVGNGKREFRGMNAVVRQDMAAFLHRLDTHIAK